MTPADTPADEIADLLLRGGAVVLSGAGLSTESGIPDYRAPDGTRRITPMSYSEFVRSAEGRQRYWARSFVGWRRFRAARPNDGHRAVTRWEQLGLLDRLITQNVDELHQASGARAVVDLHGVLSRTICLTCALSEPRADVEARMGTDNPAFDEVVQGASVDGSRVGSQIRPDGDVVVPDEAIARFVTPRCPRCGSDTIKPDVVFFGESVPRDRVEDCFAAVASARSLVVLGSSLAVMSGFRFVKRAASLGIPVAIATASSTRGDELATVRSHRPLGQLLPEVTDLVEEQLA